MSQQGSGKAAPPQRTLAVQRLGLAEHLQFPLALDAVPFHARNPLGSGLHRFYVPDWTYRLNHERGAEPLLATRNFASVVSKWVGGRDAVRLCHGSASNPVFGGAVITGALFSARCETALLS